MDSLRLHQKSARTGEPVGDGKVSKRQKDGRKELSAENTDGARDDFRSPFRPVRGEKIPRGELKEERRSGKPGIKYHPKRMPMQAAPDHGDHE